MGAGGDRGDWTRRHLLCPSRKRVLPVPPAPLSGAGLSHQCLLAERAVRAVLNIHQQTVGFVLASSVRLIVLDD